MTYKLLLLPRAERDIDGILGFLVKRSLQGAIAWDQALQAALDSIQSDPLRFSLAPELQGYDREIRQILFKTKRGRVYRALFSVIDVTIYVLHVRGPGQRPLQEGELASSEP